MINHFLKHVKCLKISLIIILSCSYSMAQVRFEKNPFEKEQPFVYMSINPDFWGQYQEKMNQKKFSEALDLIFDKNIKKLNSNELAELYLALAEVSYELKHYFVSLILIQKINKIFPLSNQSIKSYFLLEKILIDQDINDDFIIGESLIDQDINITSDKIPKELKSFISYLKLKFYRNKKINDYQKLFETNIDPKSEWAIRQSYQKALYELYNNRVDESLALFEQISLNPETSLVLQKKSNRQVARLYFEKGEFDKSFSILKKLQFEQQDQGQLLLERAWNKYYLKHYSKALGLLTALDSPIFDVSRSPETYILQMLIFNELCHYDLVSQIKNKFIKEYSTSLNVIKGRKNLNQDQGLQRLAHQSIVLRSLTQQVMDIRFDLKWIKELPKNDISLALQKDLSQKENEIKDLVALKLTNEIRRAANDLIDYDEQIQFIDYQSKVDSLKLRTADLQRNYRPESASKSTFDKLYWKYIGEFWLDELEDLRVLIKSKCK